MEKNELKFYRQTLHFTQQEVAEKAKIPLRTYQSYEQGKRLPNVRVALRLAKALKGYCDEIWLDEKDRAKAEKYMAHIERNWRKRD